MAQPLSDDLMVQEQINMDPWSHMVGVMMLNQTGRKPVKTVLPEFLERWPTPEALLRSRIVDIEELIKPLGMYKVRAKRIYKMSIDFLTWDGNDARKLHGIGKYGSDSYEIFFKRNYSVEPTDKELLRYLREIGQESLGARSPIPTICAVSNSIPIAS
jgi:methyl-CpG-binding domain protein 4